MSMIMVQKLKKTRKVYSKDLKKQAVELVMKHGLEKVAKVSGIGLTCLKRWRQDKAAPSNLRKGSKVKYPEVEDKLMQFISEKRSEYRVITSKILTKKAKSIAESLKIIEMKFTWGWLNKFMKRNSLTLRTPTTKIKKQLSVLMEAAESNVNDKKIAIKSDGKDKLDILLLL